MDGLATRDGRDRYKKQWDAVILRATADKAYRAALLNSPEEVLRREGIELPEGVRVIIHEFDLNESHVVLPPFGSQLARPGNVSLPYSRQNGG